MNELQVQGNAGLPANIADLSRFILVGREKLTAVRAEIRVIDKLGIAQEVRLQKQEESQMLAEALLDAEARIGELLKQIPTSQGKRSDLTSGQCCPEVDNTKTKSIQDLGFTVKQAQRFETLADNKDIIEQVKAEARQKDELPTRTRVLELVSQRKKAEPITLTDEQEAYREIERRKAVSCKFIDALIGINGLFINDETMDIWYENITRIGSVDDELRKVKSAKEKLSELEGFLLKKKKLRVVRNE